MPDRFPALVQWAVWLFLAGMLLGFVVPPAAQLGQATFVKEALDG